MNTLYPIIRRVRRALLPPEEKAPGTALTVCGPSSPQPSPPGEGESRAVVELPPVVADSQISSLQGESQSLLTSAATKGMKGKQAAAKSRVKAADEAHSTQP